jgi:hypothetical protein
MMVQCNKMPGLIPITIGRLAIDADLRVARIVHWLLSHQGHLGQTDSVKLTINIRSNSIKYEVLTYHDDKSEDAA